MKGILSLILSVFTLVLSAQKPLVPSKTAVEQKWIKNTTYDMTWYALRDTAKIEIGKVSTQIEATAKTLTVITRVNMKNMKEPWIDSTIATRLTLAPQYHASYNMQRNMVLHFGKVVKGFYNDKTNGQNTTIADTTQQPFFDSNLYPLIINWLPLKEGFTRDLTIYDYNPASKKGVIKASVTAVKQGTYNSQKSGIRAVWVVTVTDEISTNSVSTYYFDQKDRQLWKQEISMNNRKMLMERVE